jgi:glycosyltransferase involved in cell wall biosynthesis
MPRVSVIVPVFNAARTIEQALSSVWAQTFKDFEIIAVDDGSTDDSLGILRRCGGPLKVLQQKNRGPSAARNLGAANSSGEFLGFLDADDWWMPELLARMLPPLERDPSCVLTYCDLQLVDSVGAPLNTSLMRVLSSRAPTVSDMLDSLWPIMPSGALIRRKALDAVGGYPEALRAFEDVYLWMLLREQGNFAYVPEKLAVWRFAHFPDPLKAPGGQEVPGRIFRQMVRMRYDVDPVKHVRSRRRAPRSILGYIGLNALALGDRTTARRAFVRAIQLDPYRVRNYMRMVRTVLPAAIVRILSGRSSKVA